jgi:hypothetical protein
VDWNHTHLAGTHSPPLYSTVLVQKSKTGESLPKFLRHSLVKFSSRSILQNTGESLPKYLRHSLVSFPAVLYYRIRGNRCPNFYGIPLSSFSATLYHRKRGNRCPNFYGIPLSIPSHSISQDTGNRCPNFYDIPLSFSQPICITEYGEIAAQISTTSPPGSSDLNYKYMQ